MSDPVPEIHRWNRDVYDRAVEAGVFGPDDRMELIEGELVMTAPHGSRHATAIRLVDRVLTRVVGEDCIVQCQLPLAIADDSEPEPDVAVVEGEIVDYRDAHPSAALLVVEVVDDSLRRDRMVKRRLYARCGIPEYWIVSLPDACLEVYRDPAGDDYREVTVLRAGEVVTPLARQAATVAVSDLLP